MKKIKGILSILLLTVLLCACSSEKVQADASKVAVDYTATYVVSALNDVEYENKYTVLKEDGKIHISSLATEPYQIKENDEEKQGEQVISSSILLDASTLMPMHIEQRYTVSIKPELNARLVAEFNKNQGYAMLRTSKKNSSDEEEEKAYTVSLSDLYFDKDSLAVIIGALSAGDIALFSSNREQLQNVTLALDEKTQKVQTPAGEFDCTVYIVKPKTAFSVYGAKFYVDSESGICVKVEQQNSSMVIKDIAWKGVAVY